MGGGGGGGGGGGENGSGVVVISRSQVSDCHKTHSWNVVVVRVRMCV